MRERATRVSIPVEIRRQVKHEQDCRCAMCGAKFEHKDLFVHHIKPVSHHRKGEGEKANRRENLCALCGGCHNFADHMAIDKNIYLNELIDVFPGVQSLHSGD